MSGTENMLGAYALHAEIGRGRFASVYRARDTLRERAVALKVLHPHLLVARGVLDPLRKEVRTLTGLSHPHIVTVYEIAEVEGRLLVAMELVPGASLARAQGMPWVEMLALLRPVCAALDYAHRQGVAHRDVRPANILLDTERGPLLTDFGYVRLLGECGVNAKAGGGLLGAQGYMAPEVWKAGTGQSPADIYALACTAYELFAGQALFTGSTPTLAMWAHDAGPRFGKALAERAPAGAEAVLRRALARDPKERYRSAVAFWRALRGLERGVPAAREEAERAALAAQRRAEAETALARGEWEAARLAVGRWLAAAPDDPNALAAAAEVQRQEDAVERARQAAYWRAQTLATLAVKDWVAVRMAVGRWLAAVPDDAEALAVQAEVDAQDAAERAPDEAAEAAARARAEAQERVWQEAARRAKKREAGKGPGAKHD